MCAQHNNGGLAGNLWWESVNGSHGLYRPGGSALNSGQVAGFRAAEYIANRYQTWTLDEATALPVVEQAVSDLLASLSQTTATLDWQAERLEFQSRMRRAGAHIRSLAELRAVVPEAWAQYRRVAQGVDPTDLTESLRNRHLCFAHAVYLEALLFALESGVGSRGSAIAVDPEGVPIHVALSDVWRIIPEDEAFREKVLETVTAPDATVTSAWVLRRPLPKPDAWFETAWATFRNGEIYFAPGINRQKDLGFVAPP